MDNAKKHVALSLLKPCEPQRNHFEIPTVKHNECRQKNLSTSGLRGIWRYWKRRVFTQHGLVTQSLQLIPLAFPNCGKIIAGGTHEYSGNVHPEISTVSSSSKGKRLSLRGDCVGRYPYCGDTPQRPALSAFPRGCWRSSAPPRQSQLNCPIGSGRSPFSCRLVISASSTLRQCARSAQAGLILRRLEKAIHLFQASGKHLPKSGFGKALSYARNAWSGLAAYLNDGRIEIDNNLVENEIRPSAVGKKNYLFFGSGEAGEQSAILYTITASARRRGLDPEAYLADVIHRLPNTPATEMHTLTPAAWAAEQKRKRPAPPESALVPPAPAEPAPARSAA